MILGSIAGFVAVWFLLTTSESRAMRSSLREVKREVRKYRKNGKLLIMKTGDA